MSAEKHLSEEMLYEYADRALSGQALEQVDFHLAHCGSCRHRLIEIQQLYARIETLETVTLAHDLAPSILARLPGRPVPKFSSGVPLLLQAAAALLILIISLPGLLQQPAFSQFFTALQLNQLQLADWFMALVSFFDNAAAVLEDVFGLLPIPTNFPQPEFLDFAFILPLFIITGLLWLVGNGILLRGNPSRRS